MVVDPGALADGGGDVVAVVGAPAGAALGGDLAGAVVGGPEAGELAAVEGGFDRRASGAVEGHVRTVRLAGLVGTLVGALAVGVVEDPGALADG